MAKIVAPFKISGTLDDINFVLTKDGNNYARMKGKTGVTKEEFKNNPIFDRIRNHGKEWGYCVKKAADFRLMLKPLFDKAKDGSFAGRTNKLIYEIIQEDTTNEKGNRTVEEGIQSEHIPEILIGFEGNKNSPLHKTLKTVFEYTLKKNTIQIKDFNPENQIIWSIKQATHVQLQMATVDWNPAEETFTTCYSEEVTVEKNHKGNVTLQAEIPKGNNWKITFLYIGFAIKERRKVKPAHRKHNSVTIIACHK